MKENKKKNKKKIITLILIAIIGIVTFIGKGVYDKKINTISYNKLWEMVNNNEVEKVFISKLSEDLEIVTSDGKVKYSTSPETDDFKEKLLKKNIEVENKKAGEILSTIVSFLPTLLILLLLGSATPKGMIKQLAFPKDKVESKVKFDDVAGIEEAKDSLMEIVDYLKNPEICTKLGVRPPKGIILEGSPGTGKTLLAKAVAGEAQVPFYPVSGSDFIQLFAGAGAMRIRDIFKQAKETSPSVIFIDEIDAIGKKRKNSTSDASSEQDQTLNALLTELDGFKESNGIIVIAATNRLDVLDPALLRAGRFDRHIEVGNSDTKGREDILKVHAKNKPLAEDVDLTKLAKRTTGFSGADLENLLNESGWNAIREGREEITWEDIDMAFNTVLVGSKKKRNILSEKERKIVAYHEGGHAIMTRLFAGIPIDKISITPSSKALGYVSRNEGDILLKNKKQFFNDICIALGGRTAEKIIFGEENITNGASQDFKQATKVAYDMVCCYGMSNIGTLAINIDSEEKYMQLSEDIKNETFNEIKNIIEEAKKQTEEFLSNNKDKLELLANKLLDVENLEGEDFDKLMEC